MTLNLFDTVRLKENIDLGDGVDAPTGTLGSIVEVLNQGDAYLVECFGNWVKYDAEGHFVPSNQSDPDAFVETLGVETVYSHQLELVKPAKKSVGVRSQLLAVIEDMPEALLEEVKDFAEFVRERKMTVG
ncbi:MAG: hypothetical protein AAGD25_27765 [Cyanobacteria bacterium P01_F01_bin.150]